METKRTDQSGNHTPAPYRPNHGDPSTMPAGQVFAVASDCKGSPTIYWCGDGPDLMTAPEPVLCHHWTSNPAKATLLDLVDAESVAKAAHGAGWVNARTENRSSRVEIV